MAQATEFGLREVERQTSGSGAMLLGRTLFNRQDYNPDLQGQSGTRIYEHMRRDPEIAGGLLRWKAPLLAANWKFEEPKKKTARSKEMLELCNRYILDRFKAELLPQMLLKLDFGVSAIEKVWGVDEKGRQVYARLAPILPSSINEFEIGDLGQIVRLVQYAYVWDAATKTYKHKRQAVPDPTDGGTAREKIAVFTYRKEGDDFFGRPILREVYQAWFHKSEMWTLDGAQKERAGLGLTVIKVPGSVLNVNDPKYTRAIEIVQNLRAHESGGAVIGDDWEITTTYPTGTPPDIIGSQNYSDEQINRRMLTQFALLASSSSTGGGRSLGESGVDHFMLCEQALADSCEDDVNQQVVPPMLERNLGPLEPDEMPRLQCENLAKLTGGKLAAVLKDLKTADVIRYDRKLEEHAREANDLPPIDDATREETPDPLELATAQAAARGGAAPAAGNEAPESKKPPPAAPAKAVKATGETAVQFRREAFGHEAHVDFESMRNHLDREPITVWHRVFNPFRQQILPKIAAATAGATQAALRRGQVFGPDESRPLEKRLVDELSSALLRSYLVGRKDVALERARQLLASKAQGAVPEEGEDDDLAPTAEERNWIREIAATFVGAWYLGMITEAIKRRRIERQANTPKAETERRILEFLTGLSVPVQEADVSGLVSSSYTNGRIDQGKAYAEAITSVFYTAMLDTGTCGPCYALDGEEIPLDQVESMIPNPNCEGGERCRCQPVYVYRPTEEREAA